MQRGLAHRSPFGLAGLGRFPVLWLGLVVCAVAAATYGIAGRVLGTPQAGRALSAPAPVGSIHGAAPGAHEFARQLAGMTNQFAALQRDDARVGKVDCVQASKGHYMCSFAVLRPSRPEECHVIQAIWTPADVDSFKVTLSGRAGRCGSLREALQSLQ
jgi:hypothetical protein